jgi:hypothetical protein
MSKAPWVSSEYFTDSWSNLNSSRLIFTGRLAASRFTSEISVSSFQVLIRRSIRRMSSNTDATAASPLARSSLHSSTEQRVPMMFSLRVIHSARANPGTSTRPNKTRWNPIARVRSKMHVCGDMAAL